MENKEPYKIVTGASGLIGRAMVSHLLSCGKRVIGYDILPAPILHDNYYHIQARISGSLDISVPFNEIYYLIGDPCPSSYLQSPADSMVNAINTIIPILDSAVENSAKVFIASSSEVYGEFIDPMVEDDIGYIDIYDPRACYKESKRYIETLTNAYISQYGLNARIGRIFNTYGYYNTSDTRFIKNIIDCIKLRVPIKVYGDGTQRRSYCWIYDTIYGIMEIMRSKYIGPFNIGNPEENFSTLEVIMMVENILGNTIDIIYDDNSDMVGHKYRIPDISRIMNIGWKPRTRLKDGINILNSTHMEY
jgi:nucleoside-diphosphate-sugar epimerase